MKFVDLGPGSVPRKVAALICLTFCGLAIPITLFRMFMGVTGTVMGMITLVVLTVLCVVMIRLLRPVEPPE